MAYTTLEESNFTGLDGLMAYVSDTVPVFIPLVLLGVFAIILFGTYYGQRRLTGRGDLPASFATAGFATAVVAFTISLMPNVINSFTLIVTVVVAVIGVLVLWLAKERR